LRDDHDADETHDQGGPSVYPHLLLQDHDGQQGREQWCREADCRCRAERQHADREKPTQHRAELRQAALQMLAVAIRAQHGEPGARQYDHRYREEGEQGASERDLAQRIAFKLPFHDRIAAGEHHGRADHIGDAARDLVAPRNQRVEDGHPAF
jgi:hypothetical protein